VFNVVMAEWTAEEQAKVVAILSGKWIGSKDRKYYHILEKFELVELSGLRKVRRKKGGKIMATVESFATIVKDIHDALDHKCEKKTHLKVQETYNNIPMVVVKKIITNCIRCAEKSKKKSCRVVVVRPIVVSGTSGPH